MAIIVSQSIMPFLEEEKINSFLTSLKIVDPDLRLLPIEQFPYSRTLSDGNRISLALIWEPFEVKELNVDITRFPYPVVLFSPEKARLKGISPVFIEILKTAKMSANTKTWFLADISHANFVGKEFLVENEDTLVLLRDKRLNKYSGVFILDSENPKILCIGSISAVRDRLSPYHPVFSTKETQLLIMRSIKYLTKYTSLIETELKMSIKNKIKYWIFKSGRDKYEYRLIVAIHNPNLQLRDIITCYVDGIPMDLGIKWERLNYKNNRNLSIFMTKYNLKSFYGSNKKIIEEHPNIEFQVSFGDGKTVKITTARYPKGVLPKYNDKNLFEMISKDFQTVDIFTYLKQKFEDLLDLRKRSLQTRNLYAVRWRKKLEENKIFLSKLFRNSEKNIRKSRNFDLIEYSYVTMFNSTTTNSTMNVYESLMNSFSKIRGRFPISNPFSFIDLILIYNYIEGNIMRVMDEKPSRLLKMLITGQHPNVTSDTLDSYNYFYRHYLPKRILPLIPLESSISVANLFRKFITEKHDFEDLTVKQFYSLLKELETLGYVNIYPHITNPRNLQGINVSLSIISESLIKNIFAYLFESGGKTSLIKLSYWLDLEMNYTRAILHYLEYHDKLSREYDCHLGEIWVLKDYDVKSLKGGG